MKPPVYTPREMDAIRAADRVVVRVLFPPGQWMEQEFFPRRGQTIQAKLREVAAALEGLQHGKRACLYVGGMVRGERLIAAVRRRDPDTVWSAQEDEVR